MNTITINTDKCEKLNTLLKQKKPIKNSDNSVMNNTLCSRLNGIHVLNNSTKHVNVVTKTVNVDVSTLLKLNTFPANVTIKTFAIITTAGGIAFLNTFGRNLPFTLLWLGSSANITDGIPTVNTLDNVNWIGINGYGESINKNMIARAVA